MNGYFQKKLKIDESITPHITRHTFATALKMAGADEFYRKKLLGHSSKDITDSVYTHEDIDSLRKTVALVDYSKAKNAADETEKSALKRA